MIKFTAFSILFFGGFMLNSPHKRYLNHGSVRLVIPSLSSDGRFILFWYSPSGRRYKIYPSGGKGWFARLRRAVKYGVVFLAVGGFYEFFGNGEGRVYMRFVRMVRRIYRGVRPVKFDGQMPIYTATILPRFRGDRAFIYRVWGFVSSEFDRLNNSLVCLYGTWFDFYESPLGMVSLGRVEERLQTFSKNYRFPTTWTKIWKLREKVLLYQEKARTNKNIPFPEKILPLLPEKLYRSYKKKCEKKLLNWERATSSPLDPLIDPIPEIPAFFPHPPPYPYIYLPNFPLLFSGQHLSE